MAGKNLEENVRFLRNDGKILVRELHEGELGEIIKGGEIKILAKDKEVFGKTFGKDENAELDIKGLQTGEYSVLYKNGTGTLKRILYIGR